MDPLIEDLRYALRELAKNPGFGAAAALIVVLAVLAILAPLAARPGGGRSERVPPSAAGEVRDGD